MTAHIHEHTHPPADLDTRDARSRVAAAALLTGGFMVAEVAGGLVSGSLALLADAAHMMTDSASLALAWLGYRLAERPADATRTFGFGRVPILAAFANGLGLIVLAIWIVIEAAGRLTNPQPVMGDVLLLIAVGGLVVNLIAFAILHGGARDDLNLRGALWHVAGDLLGSLAAIAAAGVILLTGWTPIDPLLSVLVAGLVTIAGWRIVRESGHILMQGAPPGLDCAVIKADIAKNAGDIDRIVDFHVWAITETSPMATVVAVAARGVSPDRVRNAIKDRLRAKFGIDHSTVEVHGTAP